MLGPQGCTRRGVSRRDGELRARTEPCGVPGPRTRTRGLGRAASRSRSMTSRASAVTDRGVDTGPWTQRGTKQDAARGCLTRWGHSPAGSDPD